MMSVPLAQAKNQLSELIDRVEHGETIAVTKRGKSVAQLVPVPDGDAARNRQGRVKATFAQLAEFRQGLRLDGDLKAITREGLD